MIISLDGNRIALKKHTDTDLSMGSDTTLSNITDTEKNILRPQIQTELGETFKELNMDTIDKKTGMSSIDLRSRLSDLEVGSHTQFDMLVNLRFLPIEALALTRTHKRLVVSKDGKGREEMKDIAVGRQTLKSDMGFMDRVKNVFVPQKQG